MMYFYANCRPLYFYNLEAVQCSSWRPAVEDQGGAVGRAHAGGQMCSPVGSLHAGELHSRPH